MKTEQTALTKLSQYIQARIILWMMYGILIYLLKFLAPQVASFITEVSPIKDYDHAFNYAIAIETCIFLLTSIGETRAAKWFIAVSIITQFLYMHRWDDILLSSTWEDPEKASAGMRLFLGSIVFSVMAQIGIWYLSEQIKIYIEKLKAPRDQKSAAEQQERAALEQRVIAAETKAAKFEVIIKEYEQPQFKCTECQRSFNTAAALNGHMRMHKTEEVANA